MSRDRPIRRRHLGCRSSVLFHASFNVNNLYRLVYALDHRSSVYNDAGFSNLWSHSQICGKLSSSDIQNICADSAEQSDTRMRDPVEPLPIFRCTLIGPKVILQMKEISLRISNRVVRMWSCYLARIQWLIEWMAFQKCLVVNWGSYRNCSENGFGKTDFRVWFA